MIQKGLIAALALVLVGCGHTRESERPWAAGSRSFSATHRFEVQVPNGARVVRLWLPIPQEDPYQESKRLDTNASANDRTMITTDTHGNRFLFVESLHPTPGPHVVETSFDVTRYAVDAPVYPALTRAHTSEELTTFRAEVAGSSHTVITDEIRHVAREIAGSETNPIIVSRRIYDWVLDRVEYHVKDQNPDATKVMKATGTGDSTLTYQTCTGNCTDFHSLYAAISRAAGIPTREVYGSFFKSPLNGQDKDQSYHCWIEFHAPNLGWLPLDVAVADIHAGGWTPNENSRPRAVLTTADGFAGPDPKLVEYYFGNLEDRRVTWHRYRDLELEPRQDGAPLLWNATGYAEVDGAKVPVARKLTFREQGK